MQWNLDLLNLLEERKLVRVIGRFENIGGRELQCLTGEGKSVLVRMIGRFVKPKVHETKDVSNRDSTVSSCK